MRILAKVKERWVEVEQQTYPDEEALRTLIKQHPEVVPPDPDSPHSTYARNFACPPRYQIDLLGIGSDGTISIVECKLNRNREAKREVVGQILEYASGLWGMELEELERRFIAAEASWTNTAGMSPFSLLKDRGLSDDQLADCRARVTENLAAGRFRLLIAVDAFTNEVRAIIQYVNAHGGQQLKLVALAIPQFANKQVSVLVPETFGDEGLVQSQGTARAVVPIDQQLEARPELAPLLRRIHETLVETLEPKPGKASISYYIGSPAKGTAVLGLYSGLGQILPIAKGGDSQVESLLANFADLRLRAAELGMRVKDEHISITAEDHGRIEEFVELLRTALVVVPTNPGD